MNRPRRTFSTPEQYNLERRALGEEYRKWKSWTKSNKVGFFQIFSEDFTPHLQALTGNAVRLYVYLGKNSNSETGEIKVSMQTMEKFFGVTRRTIFTWMSELEDRKLIKRMQPGRKRISLTFLLPYSERFTRDEKRKANVVAKAMET